MDLSLRWKNDNWPADNFIKRHLNEFYTWARDTVRWHWSADALSWQLSVDHNIFVHKHVHYQVKHRLYMPWTPS